MRVQAVIRICCFFGNQGRIWGGCLWGKCLYAHAFKSVKTSEF